MFPLFLRGRNWLPLFSLGGGNWLPLYSLGGGLMFPLFLGGKIYGSPCSPDA